MKENIVWEAKPSVLFIWHKLLFGLIIIFSPLFIPIPQDIDFMLTETIPFPLTHNQISIFAVGLGSLFIIFPLINILTVKYVITNQRLFIFFGVFNRTRDEIEIYRIKDIQVHKPFMIRIFGLSNMNLFSSDTNTPSIILFGIKNAYKLADDLRDNVEALRKLKRVYEVD